MLLHTTSQHGSLSPSTELPPAQQTIHDLVMELGYEDTSTEVYTVDSQVGGPLVL